MDYFQIVVLALIQGVTEFLPVSSSAHLILPTHLLGWPDQGLSFDIAVHAGTLFAVLVYFRDDLRQFVVAGVEYWTDRRFNEHATLLGKLMLATAPIVIAGYFLKPTIEHEFRSLTVIALTTIGFGLLLGIADRHSQNRTELTSLRYVEALFIGVMQILALVPGTSRSGITLTAALLLGLNRVHAARFSFLLSIPVIGAASILAIRDASANDIDTNWPHFALGMGISGMTAYFCITIFLRLISRTRLMPFVIYRILLGTFLLTLL